MKRLFIGVLLVLIVSGLVTAQRAPQQPPPVAPGVTTTTAKSADDQTISVEVNLVNILFTVADKKGTRAVAEAYLKYWYSREGQEIAARNSYRPRDSEIAKEYEKSFAKVELFTIDDVFGGWAKAQKEHFAEGGIFDQIYKN